MFQSQGFQVFNCCIVGLEEPEYAIRYTIKQAHPNAKLFAADFVETVKTAIEEGNDPTQLNPNSFDPMVYAILQDAPLETLQYLQSIKDNDVNKLTHDGRTYIFWAAYKGNDSFMQYLLDNGAKTDILDDHGLTPLNFAANAS